MTDIRADIRTVEDIEARGGKMERAMLRIVRQLEWWLAKEQRVALVRLFVCPRCHAQLDAPCRRPNGALFTIGSYNAKEAHHLPRQDLAMRAYRGVMPKVRLSDMLHGYDTPQQALKKIHRQELYRRLILLRRLDWADANVLFIAGKRKHKGSLER